MVKKIYNAKSLMIFLKCHEENQVFKNRKGVIYFLLKVKYSDSSLMYMPKSCLNNGFNFRLSLCRYV
jgi:hypothetical protein